MWLLTLFPLLDLAGLLPHKDKWYKKNSCMVIFILLRLDQLVIVVLERH